MAENKDGQEKTEQATAKRLQEARNRGQFAKSNDVTTAAVLMVGGIMIFVLGIPMISDIKLLMAELFHSSSMIQLTPQNVSGYYFQLVMFLSKLILPILLVILAIVLIADISQFGFHIAKKKFTEGLNFKRIFNPIGGMKKLFFSGRSYFELLKSVIKIAILGFVVYQVFESRVEETIGLMSKPLAEIGSFLGNISLELVMKVGGVYVLIAVADFFYQKYRYKEDLKMTKHEVKEEHKQAEGDPRIKSRLRSIMRSKIRKMMLKNVESADVVVTNPTHFAVALKYKPGKMNAPVVVAKGVDFLAAQIREIAEKCGVPLVQNPLLARTLYFNVEIGLEIPENLFKAVAQVLAYVYSIKNKRKFIY